MPDKSRWAVLFDEIKRKLSAARKSPAASLYFVSIIILSGGVGWWLPIAKGQPPSLNHFMTYIFALLAAISADFLIRKNNKDESDSDEEEQELGYESVDFSMLVSAMIFVIVSVVTFSLNTEMPEAKWPLMVLSVIMLWVLWWLLLEEKKFSHTPTRDEITQSTIGAGSASRERQYSGSLAAFLNKSGEKEE